MIATTVSRNNYPGTGVIVPLVYTFPIIKETDLRVVKRSVTGLETTLNWPTDFAVTGVGASGGGTVTPTVAPANGELISIRRVRPETQTTDLKNQGTFYADVYEAALDNLTMLVQQIQDQADRSVRFSESYDPATLAMIVSPGTAGQVLSSTGVGVTWSNVSAGATILPGEGRTVPTLSTYLANNAVYHVNDYGADSSGVADSTANFLAACVALQAKGGGVLCGKGSYKVTGVAATTLFTFTNLQSVELDFSEATINDVAVYAGVDEAVLFQFVACRNITLNARVSSQVAVTTNPATTHAIGLVVCRLTQGCKNVRIDLDVTGCKAGVNPTRLFNDPDNYRSSQFRGRITASGCYYPWLAQFSGDNAEIAIDTNTCGRSFFMYGVTNQRLNVRTFNQQVTSLIKAFSGFGCRDVSVTLIDRDSTVNQAAAPRLAVEWGDSTPATHANIAIHLDTKNPVGSPWGSMVEFNKFSDGGTTPDAVGRGHVLDGFKLSGSSEQVAGVNHITQNSGAFAALDLCRNFAIRDFTGIGANSALSFGGNSPISQLTGRAVFENVTVAHNIYAFNGANGRVLFIGCQALNFSNATTDTDLHTLIECNASDGTNQSTINKLFVNTLVGTLLRNDLLLPGRNILVATKQLSGDITGAAQSIFKLSPAFATGVLFRLKYFLVYDQGDFSAGTRRETQGIKSWSATLSGAGAWTLQEAVANDVTERSLNTTPAVLTVSLVNGDATGGFIAVTATNYNNANGKYTFILEAIPMTPNAQLAAL